jgi:cytochrome bd-type quinol oxidase subunit 2
MQHKVIAYLANATDSIVNGATSACAGSCNTHGLDTIFTNVANTLSLVVGAGSVIMVIIGGLRYTTSRGDSKTVQDAKNTILYAVVGVGVSIVAFAVIHFVTGTIGR